MIEINYQKLNETFKNESVVIFVSSNNDQNFNIYWKSSKIQLFLTLKPYKGRFSEKDKDLFEYVADILDNSLQNKHLGEKKIITKSQDLLFFNIIQEFIQI